MALATIAEDMLGLENLEILAPWSYADFEPSHNSGSWMMRPHRKSELERLRIATHRAMINAAGQESFPYKPCVFASQIADICVTIHDFQEWEAWIGFDFFTQGRGVNDAYLEQLFARMPIQPYGHWWDNYNGVVGCTFDPGTFHTNRFLWSISECALIEAGFPTRDLYQLWEVMDWRRTADYWQRQPRPVFLTEAEREERRKKHRRLR